MALQSKTINGSTNLPTLWSHKIVVTENSTSIANNTSSVTVTAYIGRISTASASYMYGASISCRISVTGCSNQTISYNNAGRIDISAGGWLNIGSKTFTVPHNNDGSKTVTISSSFTNNVRPESGSSSGNMTLTKIPRQATTTNATNFNDENNPTITFSNPGNLSLRPYLSFYLNGTRIKRIERNIGSYSSPYTWSLTNTERTELRSLLANYNSCQVNIGVDTYSGSTAIGYSSLSKTFSIVNANPIFTSSDMEYSDLGGEALVDHITTNLTGDDSKIIKGYSHLAVMIIGDAIAQKGATISYYQLENVKKSFESDGETIVLKIIDIEKYNKDTITVYAVDSRNNSTSITTNITNFINYNDIVKGSISLDRNDNGTSEFVTLNYNGEFWNGDFGARNNSLTATYKFKKTTDSTYTTGTTTITPTTNNNSFSFSGLIAGDTENHGFDRDDVYEVIIEISDCLSKVTYSGLINAGTPAIAIYGNKTSIGGKYDTSLGGIQLWGDVYINGNRIS